MAEIHVTTREISGTSHSKRMRKEGQVPAIIYGEKEPQSIQLVHKDILRVLTQEGTTSIHTLNLDNKKFDVIIKEVQYHPWKDEVYHLDFKTINKNEALKTSVPITVVNEETCAGIKEGGMLIRHQETLEVTCLPKDLPESIVVDIEKLEVGQAVHISQLKLPKGVELTHKITDDNDHSVLAIQAQKAAPQEEEESAAENVAEGSNNSKEESKQD
jgi:large subunit ribosomal protein L25